MILWTGRGRWVRSSSCTTSGSTSRCRSGGSGSRWGSGAFTHLRPAAAARRRAGRGGGCVPRTCPTWATWHRRRSSSRWTFWKSSSSQSRRDFFLHFLWPSELSWQYFQHFLDIYFFYFLVTVFSLIVSRCPNGSLFLKTVDYLYFVYLNILTLFI